MTVVKCKPQTPPPPPPTPPSPPSAKPPCIACGADAMEESPSTLRLVDLLQRIRPPPIELPRHSPGEEIRTVPREKH